MNTINEVSAAVFFALNKTGKVVAVHSESNVLVIKAGTADTRIMNWQNMPLEQIVGMAKELVLQENLKGNVLLHG